MKFKKLVLTGMLIFFTASHLFSAGAQQIAPDALKYYKFADQYYKQKSYKNSLTYYSAAVKKQRDMWQAWYGIAMCYYAMKKYENARLTFRYVLQLRPGEPTSKKYYDALNKYLTKKPVNAQAFKKRVREKAKGELMWRSALLPGWGQFESEQYVKGYFFAFGFLLGAGGTVKYIIDQNEAVQKYEKANNDFDALYKKAEEASLKVWIPVGISALIWGVSILDAYLSGVDESKLKQTPPANYKGMKRSEWMNKDLVASLDLITVKF